MKILVPVKRVTDTDQKIVAAPGGAQVAIDHLPFVINPFDAIALEEAVRISERLPDVEVVAVGIGGPEYEQQLRTALAMGAARGVCVQCASVLDPWNVSRLLQAVVVREQPELVIMGKQAVDDDANQTGQFLASLLDWTQATFASRVELLEGGEIRVDRETDHGIETLVLPLPALVTTDLRLNEPRYASMAGIMKARKKPSETILAEDLGVAYEPRVEVLRYYSSDRKRRNERLGTVDELVQRLCEAIGTRS